MLPSSTRVISIEERMVLLCPKILTCRSSNKSLSVNVNNVSPFTACSTNLGPYCCNPINNKYNNI